MPLNFSSRCPTPSCQHLQFFTRASLGTKVTSPAHEGGSRDEGRTPPIRHDSGPPQCLLGERVHTPAHSPWAVVILRLVFAQGQVPPGS